MATGYDGSIRIDTKIDGKGFQKGLESMGSGLKKLAGLAAAAFGTAALVSFGKEAINAASGLSNAWIGLQSIVEGQGRSFSKAKSFIEGYIADGLVPLENAVTSYKNLAARGYDDSQIQQTMTALKDAAAFGRQASYSLGDAVMSATEGLKNENSILVDNAGVTKNVAKMWDDYAKSIGTTANNLTQAQKIQAEVSGILEETKFQAGDAAKVAGTYSGQVSLLAFNFQNLKVAVGNALIPIVQAVLPGINAIISALTTLANVFAKVTALLFGKTAKLGAGRSSGLSSQVETQKEIASSGTAAADATDKLAAATGGAGSAAKKAAKEMKGVLAPFDDLSILADNAADSLSGAAGGLGGAAGDLAIPEMEGGELFGDVNVNPVLLADAYALIDKLNEMIPLIAGIGAGLAAWKIASGLLPELGLIQKLLGSFMVGAGITLLVDSIRDIIFGDGLTWQNILKGGAGGALAGGGIGLMLAKKLGLKWMHGMLGGAVIGLGISLLIESIADILTRGLNLGNGILGLIGGALAGAAAGFLYLGGPGGAILGVAIGVGVSLVLESISDTIKSGLNLANGALGLIGGALAGAGVGFYLGGPGGAILGATIGIGLTFALEGIASQIQSVEGFFAPITDMLRDISDLLSGEISFTDFITDLSPLQTVLLGIASAIMAIVSANTALSLSQGISTFIKTVKTLDLGISEVIKGFKTLDLMNVPGFIGKISQVFTIAGSSAYTFSDAIKMVFGPGSTIAGIGAIVGGAVTAVTNFISMLKNGFSWANEALMLLGIAITSVGAIILGAPALVAGVVAAVVAAIATAVVVIKENWDSIVQWASTMFDNIKTGAVAAANAFMTALSGLKNWFVTNVSDPIANLFKGAINKIIDALNFVIGKLNVLHIDMPDWVESKFGVGSIGFNIPKIPHLANGAVIPPNQQFAAILGDQRSGMNLEAPADLIRQLVAEGIQSAGGTGGELVVNITTELDGRVVARNQVRHINDMTRAAGKPVLLI